METADIDAMAAEMETQEDVPPFCMATYQWRVQPGAQGARVPLWHLYPSQSTVKSYLLQLPE